MLVAGRRGAVRTCSRQVSRRQGTRVAEIETEMPVVPRTGVEDTGRRRLQGLAQPARPVERLDGVDVIPRAQRHDAREEVVQPGYGVCRRVPPGNARREAVEIGTHALSLSHHGADLVTPGLPDRYPYR